MAKTESTMSRIPPEFIIQRSGKDCVLYAGLLDLAHREGNLKSIRTVLIQAPNDGNKQTAICHATVESNEGRMFDGIGDANVANVTKNIAPHIIRMAETRGKARALRDFLNLGGAAVEEMGPDEETGEIPPQRQAAKPAQPIQAEPASELQYAALNNAGQKIFADFGVDMSPRIVDNMTGVQAEMLLTQFRTAYAELKNKAASNAAPTPIRKAK